jgi:release factor glutamine methyltransferase
LSEGDKPGGEPWTIRRVLAWAVADLRERGSDTPRLEAELLLAEVLGTDRVGLIVDAERPLDKTELGGYRALHKRRRAGEPVAYILGRREFYGRSFRVDARVLVPRPDTETLVETTLRRMGRAAMAARVLDVGTGSGCVAITLARERPTWRVLGVDVSEGALAVAWENATRLSALPAVGFTRGDLGDALPPHGFEAVVSNPPYIPTADLPGLARDVRDYEPRLALSPGPSGLEIIARIVRDAPRLLCPLAGRGGLLALEVGAGQAHEAARLLEAGGFTEIEIDKDYGGIERVVSGRALP